jgi:hypothetical protein
MNSSIGGGTSGRPEIHSEKDGFGKKKTSFFFRIGFFPASPRINQANLSSKLRSRAEETHIVFSDVRLVYVKPSFMCESKFVAQN